jgi:hypothetical protein
LAFVAGIVHRQEMSLPVNPAKVLRLFAPLWLLLALSLWLHWSAWQTKPALLASIALLPIAAAFATALMREQWRLELTGDALIHHTLGRRERFEWRRMGPIELTPAPVVELIVGRTFWFAFPLDAPRTAEERASAFTGRRILCVFGDLPPIDTIAQIEAWRTLRSAPAVSR